MNCSKNLPDSKRVYVVILNWNNWRDTIECLESVFQNTYPDYQVICVDNASTDNSVQMIKEWAAGKHEVKSDFFVFSCSNKPIPVICCERETAEKGGMAETGFRHKGGNPLILIRSDSNEGYAGGNNIAIRHVMKKTGWEYIWILNNDTAVDKEALSEMVTGIESNPGTGMAGSKLLYYDRRNMLQAAGGCKITPWNGNASLIGNNKKDGPEWGVPFSPDYICGASLLVKKEVIQSIGLLDESYFLYWEDADWGMRARKNNFKLLYCPGSRVWHKEGGTSGGISSLTDYYWTRNGLAFMKKFYPAFLPLAPLSYFLKHTVIRIIKRQPLNFRSFLRGVRDFFAGRTGKSKSFA
jgi:GT2 family glycosyltransferase